MSALIYCPFPDPASARKVGQTLLDEGLIGCINIGGSISSLFEWAGERSEGEECPVILKTDAALLDQAVARLEDLHPYDSPAVLGWPCIASPGTREWLARLRPTTPEQR